MRKKGRQIEEEEKKGGNLWICGWVGGEEEKNGMKCEEEKEETEEKKVNAEKVEKKS